jgi:D-amino-acid dehydrogenase
VVAKGLRHLMRRDGPFAIRPRTDPALARWLMAFRRACDPERSSRATRILTELSTLSLTLFDDLVRRGEADFGYLLGPLINAYTAERWEDRAEAFEDLLAGLDIDSEVMDADEVHELEPALSDRVRGALVIEDQASGDCYAFVRSLADTIAARGATIRTDVAVTRVLANGRGAVGVRTAEGEELEADLVVLAAGAWSSALAGPLGLRLPIEPATGYSWTMPTWPDAPTTPVISDDDHVVVLPLQDHVRFAGTLELAGYREGPDRQRLEAVARTGRALLREAPVEGEPWFGFRPLLPDDLPTIGWVPGVQGVLVATGHGTLGFTQAPITGRLVAELASGAPTSVDVEPLRPDRF